MSKTLNKTPVKNDGPSKIKKPTFKKNTAPTQDGQQQRQHKKAPGNKLKLNEFHQKVNNTHQMSYKKKMRDINRLLAKKGKDGVDESLKNKKEEELKALKKKHKESKKKRFLIKENEQKYKKIKFFEETKLRRKLRSVQNKIKNIEEGKADDSELTLEELQAEKQRIGDDLNYIKFYPMDRKYIALFPSVDDEEAKAKRESMRKQIQETMAKKSVSVQKNLERLVNSLNEERNTKMDTFFETEEDAQPKPSKKKIVDKQGRIIIAEDF